MYLSSYIAACIDCFLMMLTPIQNTTVGSDQLAWVGSLLFQIKACLWLDGDDKDDDDDNDDDDDDDDGDDDDDDGGQDDDDDDDYDDDDEGKR